MIEDEKMRDALWWLAIIVALAVLVGFAFLVQGCKSSSPRVPCPEKPPQIIQVDVPKPCIIQIEPLSSLPPAVYPSFPGESATADELKAWALALGEAIERGDAVCLARDGAWTTKVIEHNALEPLCHDP
jgi:hypothetical protein